MKQYPIYPLKFIQTDEKAVALRLYRRAKDGRQMVVFTPNLSIFGQLRRNNELVKLINRADILLPDGIGLCLAYKIRSGKSIRRVTGIDTAYELLRVAERKGLSVFLLGAERGVAEEAKRRLCFALPRLCVCGTHHGYFDKSESSWENKALIRKINQCSPDILLVCFGFPAQEKWIMQNKSALPHVKILMGLGGSLDVWAGKVKRAPAVFRKCGLEWLWRCALQPKRFLRLFSAF
ncbi:MAG: WecB/TagA/CpsF family glycosyltransferase [Clostridia bacterium]|nr:WecB/TagA/CpsF family glycosyltransferase [Clostridia bacterium]